MVHEAMDYRSKDYAGYDKKYYTAVDRIERRKQLSRRCMQLIDRSHSSEQHRCVKKRINPRKTFQNMVTHYANN